MKNDYVSIRRKLHQYPEIAFEEYNTAKLISEVMEGLSIPHSMGIAKTGLCGVITGKYPGKTILLRADMDALPITEKNDVSYASKIDGVMHACGHDVHISTVLMAADILTKHINELHGNVKLVFQPAEETVGGALPMINEGVLKNPDVDACLGFHVRPELAPGKIICAAGKIMASPDSFYITIRGNGGHCATPEKNDNLFDVCIYILSELKKIVYKDSLVVPCTVHAGTAPNIMPSELKISGSFRTFDSDTRNKIANDICECAKNAAAIFHVQCEPEIELLYPPLSNDAALTQIVCNAATKVIGKENVITEFKPSMLGEDFSYFGEYVPSSYFYLGTQRTDRDTVLHAENFDVDESAIEIGAKILAEAALMYLK